MDTLRRMYRNSLYSFKGLYGFLQPKIYILVKVINPVLQILFFSLIARHAYNGQDISPYIIGNAFVLCSMNAFFGAGCVMHSERSSGTLKNIIACPGNKFLIFTSKGLFHVLDGGITVAIGIVTGIIFLNLRIPLNALPVFILIILVSMFTACAMGLLIGSIGLVTRDINLLLNLASMSLMALSGVNFPVEQLPQGLQYISNIFPLTHCLKAARILSTESSFEGVGGLILKEAGIGILYCVFAYVIFKTMERVAKIKATIDIY